MTLAVNQGSVALVTLPEEPGVKSMELRCLMSSADSGKNFDLRCFVREQLIGYIQKHYPESLPQVRAILGNVGSAGEHEDGALVPSAARENDGKAA